MGRFPKAIGPLELAVVLVSYEIMSQRLLNRGQELVNIGRRHRRAQMESSDGDR
jgi:ribose 1,5-bisphosphokinase PhnN